MTHKTTAVARVKNPSKWLRQVIRYINNSWDMAHDNVTLFTPILDGKVLNINMTGSLSRDTIIDHIDSGHIIFI